MLALIERQELGDEQHGGEDREAAHYARHGRAADDLKEVERICRHDEDEQRDESDPRESHVLFLSENIAEQENDRYAENDHVIDDVDFVGQRAELERDKLAHAGKIEIGARLKYEEEAHDAAEDVPEHIQIFVFFVADEMHEIEADGRKDGGADETEAHPEVGHLRARAADHPLGKLKARKTEEAERSDFAESGLSVLNDDVQTEDELGDESAERDERSEAVERVTLSLHIPSPAPGARCARPSCSLSA